MWIFAKFLTEVTRAPRYQPYIPWSKDIWSSNIFRLWERIFWRRYGIRREASSGRWQSADGSSGTYQVAYTWESAFAMAELSIRSLFKLKPVRIFVPILRTPQGIPFFASPYLFAIALDVAGAALAGGSGLTATWSHTVSASATLMIAGFFSDGAPALTDPTSVVFNTTQTMTSIAGKSDITPANRVWLYYVASPNSGAHAVLATWTAAQSDLAGQSITYSGTDITGIPDSSNTANPSNSSTCTLTTTVVASGCWFAGVTRGTQGTFSSVSVGAARGGWGPANVQIWDSNATVGTGAQSEVVTGSSSLANWCGVIASFAPPGGGTTIILVPTLTLLGVG